MRFGICSVAFLIFTSFLFGQLADTAPPLLAVPPKGNAQLTVLSGKVAGEDNSPPSQPGDVILECASHIRAHAYSDARGNFSITVSVSDKSPAQGGLANQTPRPGTLSDGEWVDCELYADVAGYKSERLRLNQSPDTGTVNVGTIMLHPASNAPGFTVSINSLAAPDRAKKAFAKGQEQERKGKWAAACDYFKRAIEVYPRYALAWLELGRAQEKQNSFLEAQQSFHQAVVQDSKLLDGYVEIARIALQQQNWKDLADSTERLLEMAPESSPDYWFLNSAANYNLGNTQQAEKSAQRELRLDSKHQVPQIEYLYGLILAKKNDYKSASEHVSSYLHLAPKASDADAARKSLADFQQKAQMAEAGTR